MTVSTATTNAFDQFVDFVVGRFAVVARDAVLDARSAGAFAIARRVFASTASATRTALVPLRLATEMCTAG